MSGTHLSSAILLESARASWGPIETLAAALVLAAIAALAGIVLAASKRPGGVHSLFRAAPSQTSTSANDADRSAAELRALIAEAREMADQLAAAFDARAAELERRMNELELRAARLGAAPEYHAEPKPIAGPSTQPRPSAARLLVHEGDPMAGEIYRLSDQGLPPVEIAQQLGQHTGKVELILALRRS